MLCISLHEIEGITKHIRIGNIFVSDSFFSTLDFLIVVINLKYVKCATPLGRMLWKSIIFAKRLKY